MPRQEQVLTVFVASPSDVAPERARLEEVIAELNQTWSRSLGMRLELIRWETHTYPGFGIDGQDVINRQIPEDYDIFLGLMWHRFGTPTSRAESGSHEEYLRAKARWDKDNSSIHLMVYFKDAPVSPSQLDSVQLGKVTDFRKTLGKEGGLYWLFQSTDEFVNLVRLHLTRVVQEWHNKLPRGTESPAPPLPSNPPTITEPPKGFEGDEVGLFELSEQFEDSFAEAKNVVERIVKSTEAIGKKMQEHTKRVETATEVGQVTRAAAKRIIGKVARDMNDYAVKLDKDVPLLSNLMNTGLSALSSAISLWPDIGQDKSQQVHVADWIPAIQGLRNVLATVETQMGEFRQTVKALPRLTTELNKAKRSVCSSLQTVIDLLQTQQQVLLQTEKAVSDLIRPSAGTEGGLVSDELQTSDSHPVSTSSLTAAELRRLPPEQRDAILAAAAERAVDEYRNDAS